jgi:hypothetical protein
MLNPVVNICGETGSGKTTHKFLNFSSKRARIPWKWYEFILLGFRHAFCLNFTTRKSRDDRHNTTPQGHRHVNGNASWTRVVAVCHTKFSSVGSHPHFPFPLKLSPQARQLLVSPCGCRARDALNTDCQLASRNSPFLVDPRQAPTLLIVNHPLSVAN